MSVQSLQSLPASKMRVAPDLTTGAILPTLVGLSLPNTLSMLASVSVSVAETAYVGVLGTPALAGIAVALQQSFSNGAMGGGVSSAISRALGAKDEARAQALALHALIIGLVAGVAFTCLMLCFDRPIFRLLGANGDALNETLSYSRIVFLGSTTVWLTAMFISIIRGGGNMRLPAAIFLIVLVVQIVLGGGLGLGLGPFPRLGMAGVALGQVLAFAGSTVVLFWFLRSSRSRIALRFTGIALKRELFGEILRVGLMTCISPLQTVLTVLIVTALISHFGAEALAGYGIGARLEMVLVPIAFGIGVACVPMVGMAIGAGNVARARRVATYGGCLSALVLGTIGLIVVIAPQLWANLFTKNPASLEIAQSYLVWSGPAYAFFGLGLCLLFASQGARKVTGPVLAGTMRLVVMAGGGWWLARLDAQPWAFFALVAAGMIVYGIFAALAVYLTKWAPLAAHKA
jgi:putative MATE family efflux protein